jgi:tetratricopeptide repeat protein 30
MTSQNEEAEDLMRRIEKEEERIAYEDANKRTFHLCIVNLVIGTLYCSKGNYEFGISRIMKSLEPFNKKVALVNGSLEQIRGFMLNDVSHLFTRP